MVIVLVERGRDVLEGEAIGVYVVDGLYIERFFDLGVGRCEEVEDDENRDERVEEHI